MKGFTAQVSNVSLRATQPDLANFFSFCGSVDSVELLSTGNQRSQVALVTFKSEDALDRAVILSDSMILDEPVTVIPHQNMQHEAINIVVQQSMPVAQVSRAQDMVTDMLSYGYVLAKDAMFRAKLFDESHQLTPNTYSQLPGKQNDSYRRFSLPQTSVYDKINQGGNHADTVIANNTFLQSGSMWITGAFCRIAKAAAEVTCTVKEKMQSSGSPKFTPQCPV